MEAVKEVVKKVIQGWEKEKLVSFEPGELLKTALTKRELGHIEFKYFKKGVLGVGVNSSVWFYHLTLQKERILSRLNAECPAVKDIRFRITDIK